jgi:hypothetical protein
MKTRSGLIIDAVESRLKLATEAAEAGDAEKAERLFTNALDAERQLAPAAAKDAPAQ